MRLLFFLLLTTFFFACKKEEKQSNIPNLTFLSVLPNTVKAGSATDSIWISFQITDGDADVTGSQEPNLFIYDLRDSTLFSYKLPVIPSGIQDPDKAFKATCSVGLSAAFLLINDPTKERDTVHFGFYIKDLAGNESNVLTTPAVYLTK